jgi:GTPase SAR1 family protein
MVKSIENCQCAVCGKKAEQKHHLKYEPNEIIIPICVGCHSKIHDAHGVGKAKRKNNKEKAMQITEPLPEGWWRSQMQKVPLPRFTRVEEEELEKESAEFECSLHIHQYMPTD